MRLGSLMIRIRIIRFPLACVAFGVFAGCATGNPASSPDSPLLEANPPTASVREALPARFLVKGEDPWGRWSLGQQLVVDTSRASEGPPLWFTVLGSEHSEPDSVQVALLGPADAGPVRVTATTLNVRECPTTDCSVIAQLDRADSVIVTAFDEGWYELGNGGYVFGEYVTLPILWEFIELSGAQLQFGLFFDQALKKIYGETANYYGPLFSGYTLELRDGAVFVRLSSPFVGGSAIYKICDLMEVIADFVEQMARERLDIGYGRYSVQVRYSDSDMVTAYTSANGSITCRR